LLIIRDTIRSSGSVGSVVGLGIKLLHVTGVHLPVVEVLSFELSRATAMENTVSASSSALNISFLHGPVLTDILLNVVIVGTIGVGVHNGTVDVNVVDQGRGCLVTSAQKVNPELDTVPG